MNENLPIDPAQLDEEWLQQPLLFDEAQEYAADCLEKRDDLKDDLANLEAKIANETRQNWDDKKAPTDKIIYEQVTLDKGIQELKKEIIKAVYNKAKADASVNSLEMRKRALTKLSELHISNYFSVPNPNHMLTSGKRFYEAKKQAVEDNSKKAIDKLNENKSYRRDKETEVAPTRRKRR